MIALDVWSCFRRQTRPSSNPTCVSSWKVLRFVVPSYLVMFFHTTYQGQRYYSDDIMGAHGTTLRETTGECDAPEAMNSTCYRGNTFRKV